MTWANFYMFCFLFGLIMSVLSLLIGMFHFHLPGLDHLHLDHLHVGHGLGHAHVDAGLHPDMHLENGDHQAAGAHVSPFNFSTLMAFLAWFGAAGYLLTTMHYGALAVLMFATVAGASGAILVFLFLAKVLMRTDNTLHDSDYRLDGLLGHVSVTIREGGTGEIIFSQEGVRRTCGARGEAGTAIARGTEVVITRYEKGIAYVRPWEEMAREAGVSSTSGS
jgi:membrane protein implicated in regulation of membrane protease activity